mgnify:FL=1
MFIRVFLRIFIISPNIHSFSEYSEPLLRFCTICQRRVFETLTDLCYPVFEHIQRKRVIFMDKRHYVYLLRCADGSLYTGMTPDIARRLRQHVEHLAGCAKYTRSHPVTALALLLTTDTATTARQLEARIKRLTRAQKDALIADPAKIADLCPALAGADIRPVPGLSLIHISEPTRP